MLLEITNKLLLQINIYFVSISTWSDKRRPKYMVLLTSRYEKGQASNFNININRPDFYEFSQSWCIFKVRSRE